MKAKIPILALVLALFLAVAGVAMANGSEPWEVLGGGASDSMGGGVSLRATLGQPVVGGVAASGGNVTLGQGFWYGRAEVGYDVHLPLVLRNAP